MIVLGKMKYFMKLEGERHVNNCNKNIYGIIFSGKMRDNA